MCLFDSSFTFVFIFFRNVLYTVEIVIFTVAHLYSQLIKDNETIVDWKQTIIWYNSPTVGGTVLFNNLDTAAKIMLITKVSHTSQHFIFFWSTNSSNIKSNIWWIKLKSEWKSQFRTAGWMRGPVVLTCCWLYGQLTCTSWLTAYHATPCRTLLADVMTYHAHRRSTSLLPVLAALLWSTALVYAS